MGGSTLRPASRLRAPHFGGSATLVGQGPLPAQSPCPGPPWPDGRSRAPCPILAPVRSPSLFAPRPRSLPAPSPFSPSPVPSPSLPLPYPLLLSLSRTPLLLSSPSLLLPQHKMDLSKQIVSESNCWL
ncbi:hypothetical protein M758_UG326200 [Ceratodon purpureus]|nr:hypothetical protein M758_UG326200 [Ceratodon purpureus]